MANILEKRHPATGALLATIACTPPAAVADVVARARRAQVAWGEKSVRARGRMVQQMGRNIADSAERISACIAAETGKPDLEALTQEVLGTAHLAHYFGRQAPRILAPRRLPSRLFLHRSSYLHYAPRGVVAVIGPWNFPFALTCGDVLMALCAGNAVVLKPSEHTPMTALEIRRLADAAGLPADLVQVVQGHGDVGDALVHAGVDMVHFTGSVATGRKIAAACGSQLIPCVAELGGKDAAIVLEDADLEHTAQCLVFGAFANAGQVCASVERVYAVAPIYAPLVARVVALTQALRQGDGQAGDVDVGPMVTVQQLNHVAAHVQAAAAAGAHVHTGGTARGPYYPPTVLTEVDDTMAVCRDETFGPVLPLMPVADVAEAVRRANRSAYGLSAYVFTRNRRRGREVAERLAAGTVVVNDVLLTHAAAETPWGGLKDSGLGHTHADSGLRHMCQMHHVNEGRLPMFHNPWGYPYSGARREPLLALLRGWYGGAPWPRRLRDLVVGLVGLWHHRPRATKAP
jgi:acyl-CoA reductase-like NAD-dependent aldehyde dehydrogenase